jgi:cystathionine beta-synthase
MNYYEDVLGLIGNTPLVKLNRLNKGLKPLILAKMENLNPGFSVKDRIGISMIAAAEREGKLKPGGTIVEATSGNTGIGLALAASVKGYKCIFVMTDKASVEKSRYLKALGADVVITPVSAKPGTPDHYVTTARRIAAETPNSFIPISIHIQLILKRTIAPPAPNSGNKPKARLRTLCPASAPAERSPAPENI